MDAVIFDLDGTLLDSEPWHKKAEIETFARFGLTIDEPDLLPHVGTTLPFMLDAVAPGLGVDEFLAIERPILTRYIREEMRAFADAERLLGRLAVPLGLATSSMAWYLEETTRRFPLLGSRFAVRLCQGDVIQGKPHPEMFLLACSRLGTAPERTMVIEDSRNGVSAALAAGCYAVGVARHPEIDLSAANQVVNSLDELTLP